MRKLLIAFVLLLVLAGVVVLAGPMLIDRGAKEAIERGGTKALGVETTLADVEVGLFAGSVELDDLRVANPTGFAQPAFLSLGTGVLEVGLASLREDPIEIPRFVLSDLALTLERRDGRTNYQAILDNLARFGGGREQEPEEPAPAEPGEPGEPGPGIHIGEIAIEDVSVTVDLLPPVPAQVVPLGGIRMTDFRVESGEDPVAAIVAEIVARLIPTIFEQLPAKLPADFASEITGAIDTWRTSGVQGLIDQGKQELDKGIGAGLEKLNEKLGTGDELKKNVEEGVKKNLDKLLKKP